MCSLSERVHRDFAKLDCGGGVHFALLVAAARIMARAPRLQRFLSVTPTPASCMLRNTLSSAGSVVIALT